MKKLYRIVENKQIATFTKEICSANIIEVEVGTNGYCGGDTGHGGRTYFALRDLGGTNIKTNVITDKLGNGGVEIMFGGDCELTTFIQALEYAIEILTIQTSITRDNK